MKKVKAGWDPKARRLYRRRFGAIYHALPFAWARSFSTANIESAIDNTTTILL